MEATRDENLASGLVQIATALSKHREVSAREMELWVEIVGPHHRKPGMRAAMLRWHAVAVAEGVIVTETHEHFRQFVLGPEANAEGAAAGRAQ